jgi:uracil-DNA glycosylase family 4
MNCKNCSLHRFKRNEGFEPYIKINDIHSKHGFIVFITDYIKETEEICKSLFIGKGGQLFYELLKKSGLLSFNWIFSSALLCVPRINIQHKRDPKKEELHACYNNTLEFIKDKNVSYYILIGRLAQSQFRTMKPVKYITDPNIIYLTGGRSSSEYLSSLQKLREVYRYFYD